MLTPTATTIALTLATHPFQVLLAVIALYHAGLSFLGSASGERDQHSNTAATIFPNFDEGLRLAMGREMELFFDSIRKEDRSIMDLLDAKYTFVNERLATHYGIPNIRGAEFRRVTLPDDSPRRGILGKASLLLVTSVPQRTSPVLLRRPLTATAMVLPC